MEKDIRIKAFRRRTKSGKIINVKSHIKKIDKKTKQAQRLIKTAQVVGSVIGAVALVKKAPAIYRQLKLINNHLKFKVSRIPVNKLDTTRIKREGSEQLNDIVRNSDNAFNKQTNTVFPVLRNGEVYIYKQGKVDIHTKAALAAGMKVYPHGNNEATEALVSNLGKRFNIPVQSTEIIQANQMFNGKQSGLPGTLHKLVDGVPVSTVKSDAHLTAYAPRYYISDKEMVKNILNHPDTAKIGALDVFTGNADRTVNNYFFDIKRNKFTAIDNEAAYSLPFDYKTLSKSFKKHGKGDNLTVFKSTLKQLLDNNTPESLIDEYDNYFTKALIGADDKTIRKALDTRNEKVKRIVSNYENAKKFYQEL